MKKGYIVLLSLVVLLFSSCHDEIENELSSLNRRVTALETACEKLNNNVSALEQIVKKIQGYDFVTGVVTNRGLDGEIIGYTISFTHSASVTLYNGQSAETPIIGVRKADSGIYYWTITYPSSGTTDILDDNGAPVPATAYTPIFRIVDGKWQLSYDNGVIWRSSYGGYEFGQATGDTPKSWFTSVVDSTDYIIFNMTDSTSFTVPSWSSYEKLCKDVEAANKNYNSLVELFDAFKKKVYAKGITPIVNGTDTLGYTLTLSDGQEMSFYNGVTTNRPEISAAMDPQDSNYYWTIKYKGETEASWMLYSGNKVRASAIEGVVPSLALSRDTLNSEDPYYYWMIKYYSMFPYNFLTDNSGNKVRASVNGSACDSISVTSESVTIKVGGQDYKLFRYEDFTAVFTPSTVEMGAADTVSVKMSVETGTDEFAVLPVADNGFYASASRGGNWKTWTITIISPATFTSGEKKLPVVVSDGKGHMKTYSITIQFGNK